MNPERARVLRGGSWLYGTHNMRCAYRPADVPVGYNSHFGFRPVAKAAPPDERRILRGGSWFSDAQCVRCSYCATIPGLSDAILGFRPVAKAKP